MKIIDRQFIKATGETHYKVKTNFGMLVLRAKASKVSEKEILDIAKKMDEEKVKEMPIVKAFDLPTWTTRLHPRIFQLYMKLKGLKINHKRHSVEFFKKGKRVARLEMINGFKPGKFKKYD